MHPNYVLLVRTIIAVVFLVVGLVSVDASKHYNNDRARYDSHPLLAALGVASFAMALWAALSGVEPR